ncbi:MAG: GNAT family protein [Pirellulaceae bacterium]
MQLRVSDQISLTEFRSSDKATCVERIGDREIYQGTLRIPHPYTGDHFEQWLRNSTEATERYGEPVHFAIREGDELIGGVGFDGLTKGHRAEIGYWLGRAWWGRGVMTAVVGAACQHALARWRLVRISAHVFESNTASARVLEKCGFEMEGLLRKHHLKDGRFVDSRLFALVR